MDKTKQKVLDEYIKFRRLSNHSRGVYDIEFHIKKFLNSSKKPISQFNESVLLDYFDKIKTKYSVSFLNTIKSSYIKNFIKWHFKDFSVTFRNLDGICKTEKTEQAYKPEDMISEGNFQKMIKGEESHFWKTYFLTLFYGSCRPVEVCNLKWENIGFDEDGAFITIYSKKNKNQFIKFVPSDVAFYLKELMEKSKSEYVFANNRTNKPISVKGAYWKIKKLSQKVLGKEIDLYTLRHSIATINYNKEFMKDDDVAKQMGHTKSMKSRYVHNNTDKLKEIAKRIYISPENLPEEKKHELEKEIEQLKHERAQTEKQLHDFASEISEVKSDLLKIFSAQFKNSADGKKIFDNIKAGKYRVEVVSSDK